MFIAKDWYKSVFNVYDPMQQKMKYLLGNCISGGLAGASALTVTYPLEFVRVRMTADVGRSVRSREFKGTLHCFTRMYRKHGLLGFYRGYQMSIFGTTVYRSAYFGLFDTGYQLMQ